MRLVTLALALATVSPALAQTAPDAAPPPVQAAPPAPPSPPAKTQDQVPTREDYTLPVQQRGRYSFAPVDEGFLRFDHESGDVAFCRSRAGAWSCDAVPDSSAARQKEIGELRDQVAALQKEIASLRAPPPPPPPPPPHPVPPDTVPPSDQSGSVTLKQDIARARGFIVETWHRLVDMIESLRKDMMRKDDNGTSRT